MAIGLDGSAPRELQTAGSCWCIGFVPGLGWSPDGTQLALVTLGGDGIPNRPPGNDGTARLLVINADGSDMRLVGLEAWGTPAWQPVP
jgi:hypothetical protein